MATKKPAKKTPAAKKTAVPAPKGDAPQPAAPRNVLIPPTVGRNVYFQPSSDQLRGVFTQNDFMKPVKDRQPLFANILYVRNDRLVDINIQDHSGRLHFQANVQMVQAGDPVPDGNYAYWMPWQVGQAKS